MTFSVGSARQKEPENNLWARQQENPSQLCSKVKGLMLSPGSMRTSHRFVSFSQ